MTWICAASCAGAWVAPPSPARAVEPGVEKGEDAVLLEETLDVAIASETSARVKHLRRIKVLTARGAEDHDVASIYYNPSVSLRDLHASVVSPEGKRTEVKKQQIFDGAAFASFELYSDTRHRSISFPGVVPGAILEYSYEEEVRNLFYLPDDLDFQETIPVLSKTFTVRVPASFPLRSTVRGAPEYTRQEEGGTVIHRWHVHDVPALKSEYDMPPDEDVVPRVRLYVTRMLWDGRPIDATDWNGIARWYMGLAQDRMVPVDEVAAKARELTAQAADPAEKTRRLYEFVQANVNYVAIELGIGGFQPHDNGSVLRLRYGDCKDKATLLISMLRALGLRGDPVLILTRDEGQKERDYPSPAFNHAIVAIPSPDGYLFLDPTSEQTAYGDLPWQDQGADALVVKEDGTGDLVRTPLFPPEQNRLRWLATAAVGPAGDLEGSYVVEAWGQERAGFAAFMAGTKPSEREDGLARFMARACPGAVLLGQEVTTPTAPGEPLRLTIRFRVPRYLVRAGSLEVLSPHLVRFPDLARVAAYPGRRHPIFFDYLRSEISEVRLILPQGRVPKRLLAGGTLEGPGVKAITSYEMARERGRDVLVVKRSLSIARREIPTAEYPALRQTLSAITEEESRAVTLQPAP